MGSSLLVKREDNLEDLFLLSNAQAAGTSSAGNPSLARSSPPAEWVDTLEGSSFLSHINTGTSGAANASLAAADDAISSPVVNREDNLEDLLLLSRTETGASTVTKSLAIANEISVSSDFTVDLMV